MKIINKIIKKKFKILIKNIKNKIIIIYKTNFIIKV